MHRDQEVGPEATSDESNVLPPLTDALCSIKQHRAILADMLVEAPKSVSCCGRRCHRWELGHRHGLRLRMAWVIWLGMRRGLWNDGGCTEP